VREFVDFAFAESGIAIAWKGTGIDEKGVDKNGRVLVEVDPRFFRPAEVDILCGDASKARQKLGWAPKQKFADLVKEMVRHDVQLLKNR
jgi:GDPmannose 4,6-dehydratase